MAGLGRGREARDLHPLIAVVPVLHHPRLARTDLDWTVELDLDQPAYPGFLFLFLFLFLRLGYPRPELGRRWVDSAWPPLASAFPSRERRLQVGSPADPAVESSGGFGGTKSGWLERHQVRAGP